MIDRPSAKHIAEERSIDGLGEIRKDYAIHFNQPSFFIFISLCNEPAKDQDIYTNEQANHNL